MERKWAIKKQKLGSAKRLRGIYFIDPAGAVFEETITNVLKKLEVPMSLQDQGKTCKKLVAILMLPERNTHASLKPTNLRESIWKELRTKIMKTALKRKESFQ